MIPYNYETQNSVNGLLSPSELHIRDNAIFQHFRRYLLQKAISVFEWKLPETWNRDYFLYVLYSYGYIAIINSGAKYGIIPQQCSFMEQNIFYAPRKVLVANPLLPDVKEKVIDKECVLLKLTPDYIGISDLVNYYAAKLSLISEAVDMNLINSKLAYVFAAGSKTAAESFKKLYDDIASGKPAVVMDKDLKNDDGTMAWDTFSNNLKQNYIVTDLLSDARKIEAMYDTEIGIPNANTDKRERLITDEVNANNTETASRAALWLEQLQAGCKKVNDMFGLNISVDWRVDPNEQSNAIINRPV